MPSTPLTLDRLGRLPIFPLPDVQLFPGAVLPLHVFEERYVQLIKDVLKTEDKCLGIPTLKPGYEGEYDSAPAVYPVMGAGDILAAEERADGRWNVLVRGVSRVRLIGEHHTDTSYREIEVERLEETDVEPGHHLDKRLRSLLIQIADHAEGAREALHLIVGQAETPAMLTNLLGAHACSDSTLRRQIFWNA